MNAKIKRHLNKPDMGNRSQNTIGIQLLMHPSFFAKCSSVGNVNRTYQPICKIFAIHTQEQLDCRNQMVKTLEAADFTKSEALAEWRDIVTHCTGAATREFVRLYGDVADYLEPSARADKCLRHAAAIAMAEMIKEVDLRMRGTKANRTPTPVFCFSYSNERTVRDVKLGVRVKVFRRDAELCGGVQRCMICKNENPGAAWHVDHKIPLAKGGTNHIDNLQTLCANCNLGKGKT